MSTIEPISRLNFIFDIIVTRLQFIKDKIDDPADLLINLKFNSIGVSITSSRINVGDFRAGRCTEFVSDPSALRTNLERNGMPITVRNKGMTLGTALVALPQSFIDRIEVGMSDLVFEHKCSIIRRDAEVGTLEFLCTLIIKCDEQPQQTVTCNSACENLAKAFNPTDIMFVVGAPQPCPLPCEPCLDELEPEEGDERLQLDLDRYRRRSQRVTTPPEKICGMEACCQLKTMTKQYEECIESVIEKVSHLPSPMPNGDLCFTDWSGKQKTFKHKATDHTIPVPVKDMEEEMGIKPIRFCPICLTPMSWLPKYTPCPKCCAVPIPQIEAEEKPTAAQIIREYLKLPSNSDEDFCHDPCDEAKKMKKKEKEFQNSRRCSCTIDKCCTHCRVRSLCSGTFGPAHETSTPDSDENFYVESKDRRPCLELVFSELRAMYDERDEKKRAKLNKTFGQKPDLARNSSTSAGLRATGSPTLLHRSLNAPKLGHKTCLKRQGIVSRRHGWTWPSSKEARKYGWRPGAIHRYVGAIMKFFLTKTTEHNSYNICRCVEDAESRKQLPILNVCKRNGEIFIALRALNNPNVRMEPIVFKVVKRDLAVALREIKRKFKDMGFPKCTCHNTVMLCVCRSSVEKKHLESALRKECERRGIENCVDHLVLTDTSDSEMEFDFDVSPPAAVVKPLLAIKPRSINISTQTFKKVETVPSKYPIPVDHYWRTYDCAAGDRFTSTAFGAPGEAVFEDGVFGYRAGGPHGKSVSPGGRPKTARVWGASPGPMRGGGRLGPGAICRIGKSFPGCKTKSSSPSPVIPVRMPKRYVEGLKKAAQSEKDAIEKQKGKKKAVDPMKYLMEKGTVAKPWNPNDPQPK
ncbi:uncharacterized protein LOC6567263 [Drosophila grimshawi]|uniref:GH23716 n=1 Tax=Drosophila grimshawi TaxID=7222 RepID=B4JTC4_DROGR|nr:uncharacterized protein LOC6567263 [Drosophila grimshawi]EDV95014.1 GH23716 [Drosophila grimshawi]